ncbi:MAG: Hsp20/alpha crystallin family protein [Candidatus Rifleibacteriota bacterium]
MKPLKIFGLLVIVMVLASFAVSLRAEIKDVLGDQKNQTESEKNDLLRPFGAMKIPSDPFFDNFEKEMEQMFDSFKGLHGFKGMQIPDLTRNMHGFNQGRADVRVEGDKVLVEIDLPGHTKDGIDLRLRGNELVISSERKSEQSEEDKDRFFRREISYGNFSRVIALPRRVLEEGSSAVYQDGVLKVTLPIDKSSPADENGYKIPIK